MNRNFMAMVEAQAAAGKFVCVGLDSEIAKIPEAARRETEKLHDLINQYR